MTSFYLGVAAVLLLTLLVGLYRVVKGPAPADRMIAAQLFATTGIAVILVLGTVMEEPAATDIAIVFAVLGALATVVFVRCGGALGGEEGRDESPDLRPRRRSGDE